MTESGEGQRVVSFEQACSEATRLADGAVQASAKLLQAAKRLAKAASEGDIAKIRKTSEGLSSAMSAARQEIANAVTGWHLSPDEEQRLLENGYAAELIAAASREGVTIHRHEQRLVAFPSVLRILPTKRAVQIDRKSTTAIRPSRVVAALKVAAGKKSGLTPEKFIETLYAAYQLVVGSSGGGTTLSQIYEALTLHPDVRRDYSVSDFTRDVFMLDRSGVVETKSGAKLSLPAATGTKGSNTLTFVSPSGEPVTYYGIRFTP